ncbi:BamA/TamA family outer membrane protein [Variovorax ureilyticus]|uniref:BamA/TamA family outer membrane protein n=1 Tax=Variovorax ureilyticus TaxID=1836198 RepID=UPI003BF58FC0
MDGYLGRTVALCQRQTKFWFQSPGCSTGQRPVGRDHPGGAGALLQRDTRDNKLKSHDGSLLEFNTMFVQTVVGGDMSYNAFDARYRKYWSLRHDLVFAADVHGCARTGNVPREAGRRSRDAG